MIQYWSNLNEREQWAVIGGGILTISYLIYALLYSPLQTSIDTKIKFLKENKTTLVWMKQARLQTFSLKTPQSISKSKLLTIIATQLNNNSFQPFQHHIQQTSLGDIELTFEKVPYLPFLNWLWKLENNYRVSLKQLTIQNTSLNGIVKINLTLMTQ